MWEEEEYHFYGQRADERVVLVRNQHPIVLVKPAIVDLVAFGVMLILISYLSAPFNQYVLILFSVGILFHIAYYVYAYRNGMSVLSTQRIIDINQRGFFNKKISEAELTRIQDVSSNINGVLQTMFGFGDVVIRTASETTLVLSNIKNPYDVQQAIARAMKSESKG